MKKKVIEFLRESNNIEDVWDEDSLQQAIYAWEYLIAQPRLTTSVVLRTHKILMLHQPLQPNEKGYWRQCQVWVGGREGRPYAMVPSLMQEWCEDANTSVQVPGKDGENIKIDHIEFEKIHGFIDGNGRCGRLLMNWQRLKAGLPILIIKYKDRFEYYGWFEK